MRKYNRIFVIVLDSLGIGGMKDSPEYGDVGVNTLGHIAEAKELQIPNLQKMGLANLCELQNVAPVESPLGKYTKLNEMSCGKDTMTGHWEMMGLHVTKPFQTFTDLQVEQAKVDLNIVPLVNNQFSNCKSELKYFETAIVGTITCATPTYTYRQAITHGDNGYLCEAGEWLPVFEKIYAEGVSTEKKQYICKRALEEYGSKSQLKHLEYVFNTVYAGEEK